MRRGSAQLTSSLASTAAGIAVTAANPPYPNLCYYGGGGCQASPPGPYSVARIGPIWVTEPDAGGLATPADPVSAYVLDLRLGDPAGAQAFASRYDSGQPGFHPFGPVTRSRRNLARQRRRS